MTISGSGFRHDFNFLAMFSFESGLVNVNLIQGMSQEIENIQADTNIDDLLLLIMFSHSLAIHNQFYYVYENCIWAKFSYFDDELKLVRVIKVGLNGPHE